MSYDLGVDLGTTYTAAAVVRDGRATMVDLGNRSTAVPSVVHVGPDGSTTVGEAAARLALSDPARVAREYKRRLGDPTPILIGGVPHSADALTAHMLRWVVDEVSRREGSAPNAIAVAHPANWGPYKKDLLGQAIRQADLRTAEVITEPEAAVMHYASQARVEPGSVIAVYDLGGGTFDAAVVRKTVDGVELLGEPEGIERLGGIDFDEAVFRHVLGSLGDAVQQLDDSDPNTLTAIARLRSDCVDAKEALSSTNETAIPVLLPGIQTEVRLTRAELEHMVRPPVTTSIAALRRALGSAGIEASQLTSVLLVGGSSRIPLVSEMVGNDLGRPVAVDAHPKHAIALGTALHSARARGNAVPSPAAAPAAPPAAPAAPPAAPAAPPAPQVPLATPSAPEPVRPQAAAPAAPAPPTPAPAAEPPQPTVIADIRSSLPAAGVSAAEAARHIPSAGGTGGTGQGGTGDLFVPSQAPKESGSGSGSKMAMIAGAAAVVVVAVVVGIFVLGGGDDSGGDDTAVADDGTTNTGADEGTDGVEPDDGALGDDTATADDAADDAVDGVVDADPTPEPTAEPTAEPTPVPVCPDANVRCIELLDVTINEAADTMTVEWDATFAPNVNGDHAHFFWIDLFDPSTVGSGGGGEWEVTASQPYVGNAFGFRPSQFPGGVTQICATPANLNHQVIDATVFDCIDLP